MKNSENVQAVLVYANVKGESENVERDLDELKLLCSATNIEEVARLTQNVNDVNPATLIGEGKLKELSDLVKNTNADAIVFENDLSGTKIKNIEDATGVQVLTRSMVILDIFAGRATTAEGKLQTEIAELKYMSTRLTHSEQMLGKYKSSVGMRGPGETKLELDRRKIKERITKLERELKEMDKQKDIGLNKRNKSNVKTVALVGYTNAGKSTLFNAITKADVLAKNMLFATLDTTSRRVYVNENCQFVLSDTIGFVNKLPHEFVEAFKSTLKEAVNCDLLLIVVDATSKNAKKEYDVVLSVLNEINATNSKQIVVLNKCDGNVNREQVDEIKADGKTCVEISALKKTNLDVLKTQIAKIL